MVEEVSWEDFGTKPIEDDEIWKKIQNVQILDLFQFDSDVGSQAAKMIRPRSIMELADANGSTLALTHFTVYQRGRIYYAANGEA